MSVCVFTCLPPFAPGPPPPFEPVKAAATPAQGEAAKQQSAATALGDSMKEVVGSY